MGILIGSMPIAIHLSSLASINALIYTRHLQNCDSRAYINYNFTRSNAVSGFSFMNLFVKDLHEPDGGVWLLENDTNSCKTSLIATQNKKLPGETTSITLYNPFHYN